MEPILSGEIYGDSFSEIYANISNQNVYDVTLDDDSGWTYIDDRGTASTTIQCFLYEAGKTIDLYFDYVNRTPTGSLTVTKPTNAIEVVHGGDITLATLRAAAGFKVEATFNNGETVDVTNSVNAVLKTSHTGLTGGASGNATITTVTLGYTENSVEVTDNVGGGGVTYINYATVANTTTVGLAADCANLTLADWSASFVGSVPSKIKKGDTINVLVTFKDDSDTTDASGATWTATLTGATLSITKASDVAYTAGADGTAATYAVTIHVDGDSAAATTGNVSVKEAA